MTVAPLLIATLLFSFATPAQPVPIGMCAAAGGPRQPIIDVHMHALASAPDPVIAELDAHNVRAVVVSSLMLPRTQAWVAY